jgi:hypothetical protein
VNFSGSSSAASVGGAASGSASVGGAAAEFSGGSLDELEDAQLDGGSMVGFSSARTQLTHLEDNSKLDNYSRAVLWDSTKSAQEYTTLPQN